MSFAVVEARNVSRIFPMPAGPVAALRDVVLRIRPGEYVGVVGPSGCGKSTLLHVLGLVDVPTSGEVLFQGREVRALPDAARSGLRLREIGCSAGLNLQWHRFHYELGPHRWGDSRSPARVEADWRGPPAPFDVSARVESRAGCDLDPRRVERDEEVRVLEGYVWPDQPERLALLRAAVRVWREDPPRIDAARAIEWLPAELGADTRGSCLVVFHSSVWTYLPEPERVAVREALERRGARASASNPLAWLRAEDEPARPGHMEVKLTLWPGGQERRLANGHPHGRSVEWLAA